MNVEIGTETPIFLFWDYLFRNFDILSLQCRVFLLTHKIIKRKNGIFIDNLANFLSISPNQTKFFLSVCLAPAGHFCYFGFSLWGVNNLYCWILKLLRGPRIFKLLNLYGSQLISLPWLRMPLFILFGEKYSNSWIWNDIDRNCLLGCRRK